MRSIIVESNHNRMAANDIHIFTETVSAKSYRHYMSACPSAKRASLTVSKLKNQRNPVRFLFSVQVRWHQLLATFVLPRLGRCIPNWNEMVGFSKVLQLFISKFLVDRHRDIRSGRIAKRLLFGAFSMKTSFLYSPGHGCISSWTRTTDHSPSER